jgi:integrase
MNVSFYVNQYKKDKDDNSPFEVIITANNTRAKFTLKHKIKYYIWNNKKQEFVFKDPMRLRTFQMIDATTSEVEDVESQNKISDIATYGEISKQLELVKTRLYEAENKLMMLGLAIDATAIRDMYFGKIKGKQHSLTAYYNDFLETKNKRVGKEIVKDTYQKYERVLKHFKNFIKLKYRRDDLQLMEINLSMINAFFSYLLNDLNISNNSAVGYMKNFKAVLLLAQQDKLIESNPMNNFKTHIEKKDIIYLTKEELSIIYKKEIENERLEKVRDLFVFACFTGLSFVDLTNLDTKKHIKQDKQGNTYIFKERTKTSVEASIPLLPITKEILEKYCYNLPVLSNQKYNAYLKEIQNICNIKKTLHSHICRHTCATMLLNNGVSLLTVSKILGHANTKITEQTYAKLLPSTIMDEVNSIADKLQL